MLLLYDNASAAYQPQVIFNASFGLVNFPLDQTRLDLAEFLTEITGEVDGMQQIEQSVTNEPDKVVHESHADKLFCEYMSIHGSIVVGIEVVRDEHGESSRTWYLASQPLNNLSLVQRLKRFFQNGPKDPLVY